MLYYNKIHVFFIIYLYHSDIWKLGRDFKEFPACKVVENNCFDCGKFANTVLNRSCRWSLEKLTEYLVSTLITIKQISNDKWKLILFIV